jgi:hypothetical protein
MFRTIELKDLKPNPKRDFTVDPLDADVVAKLKESIKEHGFWSGVTARRHNGEIQVAAGWHRCKAAIAAGEREAQIFIGDFDDRDMVRVYASENATQRGNSSTALAGTVASAVRYLAKAIMTGEVVSQKFLGKDDLAKVQGNITSQRGLGEDIILRFLTDIPGINSGVVQQQLANIKASGDYARIIGEVTAEIEEEHKEAIKAMERAEKERIAAAEAAERAEQERKDAAAKVKAAKEERDRARAIEAQKKAEIAAHEAEKRRQKMEKDAAEFDALRTTVETARNAADVANDRDITFDFEGVAAVLQNPLQVDVFRKAVTSDSIRPYLAVSKQASLATRLAKMAKDQDAELSGTFIRQNIGSMILDVKGVERKLDREDREKLKVHNWESRAKDYQHDFSRSVRFAYGIAQDIIRHNKMRPAGSEFYRSGEFSNALDTARQLCKLLSQL